MGNNFFQSDRWDLPVRLRRAWIVHERDHRGPTIRPAVLAIVALAGCFSEHTEPSAGGEGVTVGNNFFRSNHNGSANPALDTVAVGSTLTWTWVGTGTVPHSVQSLGSPGFPGSATLTGDGQAYSFMFTTPGTYRYDCVVHGSAMTGTVVVR
jgi:plastocyanin